VTTRTGARDQCARAAAPKLPQIWIAVSVYVLVAIIKKELALEISLYTFSQILSVRPFEKTQISSAFLDVDDSCEVPMSPNQLNLFNN
jgi:hypothetical protein